MNNEKTIKNKVVDFLKKETVMAVAAILAVISAFFVPPSSVYAGYIDFRVLGLLLSLMTVMAGLQYNGIFDAAGNYLLKKCSSTLSLSFLLVFLCYFFSMFITNDVALITFVPFALLTLKKSHKEQMLIPVVILQTVGANLGSMLTPIGNPQNLYLYNAGGFELSEFLMTMLPYTILAGAVIALMLFIICRMNRDNSKENYRLDMETQVHLQPAQRRKAIIYAILFILCLMVVGRIVPYYCVLLIVMTVVYIMDKEVLKTVDYNLLFTFIFFFIFTGNLGRLDIINHMLQKGVSGREILLGITTSQFISNVPATLLLSGFTNDYRALLLGVNFGGLGTLIASMASLISYKAFAHEYNEKKGRYLLYFTISNMLLLLILVGVHECIGVNGGF